MKLRLSLFIVVLAAALSVVVAVASPSATAARSTGSAPTQQLTATYNGNSYVGTFNVTSFKKVGDVIRAYGTFTGTNVTNSADKVTSAGYADVITNGTSNTAAAAAPAGSCQILDLTLGPINLDLLGLVVTTNPIHLNITAQQGPGNLLGNLLCAVTGLLDNTGTTGGGLSGLLTAITNLLNHILTQL